MDTKWKKRKILFSAISFVLGASLTIGGMAGFLRDKPGSVRLWQADRLFQGDYQLDYRFQDYVTGRFWNFLTMAVGGDLVRSWGYDSYYESDGRTTAVVIQDTGVISAGNETVDVIPKEDVDTGGGSDLGRLKEMTDAYEELEEEWERLVEEGADEAAEEYREQLEDYRRELEDYRSEMGNGRKALTEEEKKEAAKKYHDRIKGDKNLLYMISCEDQVLYANSELLQADGKMSAPEGYNFLLYFDGKKVRIVKDGKELDVYGDGYYREENAWRQTDAGSDWYVPGYQNFPVDESLKKAKVFLAVAKEPVLYMEGAYGASARYDNSLYWMDYNYRTNRKILAEEAVCFAAGLVLLFLAFLNRRSGREAAEKAAGVQAKIWAEGKALLILGACVFVYFFVRSGNQVYGWWQELKEAYYYEYEAGSLFLYGGEIVKNVHPAAWVVLFWIVWSVWNDLRYNKKLWKNSLCGKLYRAFSAKSLHLPLAKRMARRNATILFAVTAVYGLLLCGMAVLGMCGYGNITVFVPVALCGAALLVFTYLACRKNVETARDVEVVAGRINEIRDGNYTGVGSDFTGHDLQNVMAQLEDIRCGLKKAVEEQMKSQKMKVELIANVSHDIRTPLTSIISYVQFLKQEEGLPGHIKDYVRILDEKSERLKNMVQDVFAVSKAASGELPVQMEELDFGKLLRQTLADMEEQIAESEVSFRAQIPEEPVMIEADGERMYRVFQNLFQNAIQYSLAGSRVYVTLQTEGAMAYAAVKNTSRMELDKEKNFAERFARGDMSRTDGGSGLGLSIAQSFTEACGGEFSWETDADLFVVKVSF